MSQVPFTMSDARSAPTKATGMELLAGAIVVTQAVETGALRPTLGWAVREAPPIEQALLHLAEHHIERAKSGLSQRALAARDVYSSQPTWCGSIRS